MQLQWNGQVGPATIVSLVGSLGVLVALGIAWGTITTKQENSGTKLDGIQSKVDQHDKTISSITAHVVKAETQLNMVLPTLQRIEQKLDNAAPAPHGPP